VLARRLKACAAVGLGACVAFQVQVAAWADDPHGSSDVSFEADDVRLDGPSRSMDVSGHVRVDEPPFYLTSPELKLWRLPIGVRLEGAGRLSFCPCLGTPVAVRFSEATVAPPHDLVLKDPVLELFGVPVAWVPVVWLRSAGRVGLLPPDLEWRGHDGFFAGAGLHVPWRYGDLVQGISIRAGGYVDGGLAVETAVITTGTSTRIRWDRFRSDDGVSIDARGSTASVEAEGGQAASWRLNALRGARAVASTTDVGAAAQPFDRAEGQASWIGSGWTFGSGVRTVAVRGGDLGELGVGGPVIAARRSEALAGIGAYDVTLEGGQLSGAGFGAITFARGATGIFIAARAGPLGAHVVFRGAGGVATDRAHETGEGTAEGRLVLDLPLARSYASSEPFDAWVHVTEPRLEAAVLASHVGDALVPVGRGMLFPEGLGGVVAAGWDNRLMRTSSRAGADLQAVAGIAATTQRYLPLVRVRVDLEGPWTALHGDFARALAPGSDAGGALVSSARLGPDLGLNLNVHVAERDRVDPLMARSLLDPALEPESGFMSSSGWSGGARASLPLGSRVALRGGADVDLEARTLVAALAGIEVHDPCNCLVARLNGAHRIGRGGVDVWLSIDLPVGR
jgi:hypothetical protein